MDIGKVPNKILEEIVFKNIMHKREDVLLRSGIGEDCAVIDFDKYGCVISSDPITGASENIGKIAVHISCNDVASNGAEPVGIMLTILAPEGTTVKELETIMKDAGEVSKDLNVEIIGGHTEITNAVNKIVVSTTVIGKQRIENVLKPENVNVGDKVLMTKYAGLEGTAIIAFDKEDEIENKISKELIKRGKSFINDISVVKEGLLCGNLGVDYMHDITEGGLLGAIWESAKAVNKGILINKSLIPIDEATDEICKFYNIDPLKLISSGSMVIIANEEKTNRIIEILGNENIKVTVIGEIIDKDILMNKNETLYKIEEPMSDELYKVV